MLLFWHDIQNELVAVMGRKVIEKIQAEVSQAQYNNSWWEQGYLQEEAVVNYPAYYIHKRFVGYKHATELNVTALYKYILQVISEMQLDLKGCVSQCYDWVSVISRECAGVSAKILERNTKAVYIHCCAHRLNLALVKAIPAAETSLACYKCCMSSCHPLRPMKYFLNSRKC